MFFHLHRKVQRSTIQIYDGLCLKMLCTRFDSPCFQLAQQSYPKSQLLVKRKIALHGRKTCAPIFKGEHLTEQTATNPRVNWI